MSVDIRNERMNEADYLYVISELNQWSRGWMRVEGRVDIGARLG